MQRRGHSKLGDRQSQRRRVRRGLDCGKEWWKEWNERKKSVCDRVCVLLSACLFSMEEEKIDGWNEVCSAVVMEVDAD
jgi:hypothetical protein